MGVPPVGVKAQKQPLSGRQHPFGGRFRGDLGRHALSGPKQPPAHHSGQTIPQRPYYDVHCIFVEVRQHPLFNAWLKELAGADQLQEVFGEVMALINALESHGRELEGDESHPVASTQYDLHALRRNPRLRPRPTPTGRPCCGCSTATSDTTPDAT